MKTFVVLVFDATRHDDFVAIHSCASISELADAVIYK
jgi:hypothetical protein